MDFDQKLIDEVHLDFDKFNNVISLLASYVDQLRPITEEYRTESNIPPDHDYWTIRTKILITQFLHSQELLPIPEPPLNAKQSYRMLKYGRGHKFNR